MKRVKRVVVDTNVLISGTFWTGDSFRILKLVDEDKLQLVLSPEIIEEYLKVMNYDEILEKTTEETRHAAELAVRKIVLQALLIQPANHFEAVKADPKDDKFIDAALEAKAEYIITQDRHLLDIKEFKNIRIITPKEFIVLQNP